MDGRDIGAKQSFVALPGYDGNRMPRHLASTARMSESISGFSDLCSRTDKRVSVPHFLEALRARGIKPQFPNGVVSCVSFVSTTNTARSLAGSVSLALALTAWRSPGISEKLCPAL